MKLSRFRSCPGRMMVAALLIFTSISLSAQRLIRGQVLDAVTRKPLAFANLYIEELQQGAASNAEGEFQIRLQDNRPVHVKASYMGYAESVRRVSMDTDTLMIALRQDAVYLPGITVTSSRMTSTVRNEPLPLTVMPASRLSDLAPVTLSDALDETPGLTVARDGVWGTHVAIRGLSRQKVVVLVDGCRIETATNLAAGLSLVDVRDIQRIEVIKGAASTLYGSGAMGGVVNIVTRPGAFTETFQVQGAMQAGYQSANEGQTGHLSLTASGSRWFVKAQGSLRNAENVRTPDGILANSQFSDENVSVTAGLRIHPHHDLVFQMQRFDAEDVGIPGGAPFPQTATARYPEETRRLYAAEYRFRPENSRLSELSLKLYQQSIGRDVELKPNANAVVRPGADHLTRGGILKAQWLGHVTLGVEAWQRDLDTWRTKEIIPQNKIVGEKPVPNSTYQSVGLFLQNRWAILPKVNATLGARVDRIRVTHEEAYQPEYMIQNGQRVERPGNNQLWQSGDASDWSASVQAGLIWSALPDVDVTLNAARSFRSPTLEERFQYIELGGATYWGDPDLKPEHGLFFDLGLRLWKTPLTVSANLFYNALSNLVVDAFVEEGLYRKDNVGSACLTGLEWDVEYRVARAATLYGNVSYVYGKDTETDTPLPEIPPMSGRLGFRMAVGQYAFIDVNARATASQERVAEGEPETEGYTIFNVNVQSKTLRVGGVQGRLVAGVDNLTDVAYRRHLSTYRGLIRLEPGRNVKLTWMMEF